MRYVEIDLCQDLVSLLQLKEVWEGYEGFKVEGRGRAAKSYSIGCEVAGGG